MFVAVDLFWEMARPWLGFVSAHRALFLTGTACTLMSAETRSFGAHKVCVLVAFILLSLLTGDLTKKETTHLKTFWVGSSLRGHHTCTM